MASIFTKIINREIEADIVYEDDLVIAFKDINPQAPVHVLIVPKQEIATVNDVAADDEAALGRLFTAAATIAKAHNIDASGYRLMVNVNDDGGQEVFHIHMHLLGGRNLGPMLSKRD
jgi:histidine triad (HIT) family protein